MEVENVALEEEGKVTDCKKSSIQALEIITGGVCNLFLA